MPSYAEGNATALQAGDFDEGSTDLFSGAERAAAAASFRPNTSTGGDNWLLREYAIVATEDLDRFGIDASRWKKRCITPMQYLLNVMSMIPKKGKGDCQMIASMASGWRCDTKLDANGERVWNAQVADENDAARPGSCCLHVMEDRQIFIDILRALGCDALQGLWGFTKFYDSIDPKCSSSSSARKTVGAPRPP